MRIFTLIALWLVAAAPAHAAFDSAVAAQEKNVEILRITPEGNDVSAGREIVLQFNRPMVPVGDMGREQAELPLDITPAVNCQWRWLNTSALSCQLDNDEKLTESTEYTLHIRPGIKSEDGQTIDHAITHRFITARADISYTNFKTWRGPGTPVIRVVFNQPVTKSSVEHSLFFMAAEKSGRHYGLTAERDPDDYETPVFVQVPGTKMVAILSPGDKRHSDEDEHKLGTETARRVWLVSPDQALPLESTMRLQVHPGLISAMGNAPGIVNRIVVQFDTFPAFRFLGVKCANLNGEDILFSPDQPAPGMCDPMKRSALAFSAPIMRSQIKNILTFDPPLNFVVDGTDQWGDNTDQYDLQRAYEKGKTYDINIPFGIKAATTYHIVSNEPEKRLRQRIKDWLASLFITVPQSNVRDQFDRPLLNRIDVTFATDHRKPNFEIIHNTAVLEKQIESEVPLYVNNIDKTSFAYRSLSAAGAKPDQISEQKPAAVKDVQFAIPFDVRGMLGGKSGAVYGRLDTEPAVEKYEGAHRLFAIVSPWQLHVKIGHFNTMVWVMDMATGQPVPNARVRIYKDSISNLGDRQKSLSDAMTGPDGVAVLKGTESLDPDLQLYTHWNDDEERLFVRVDKGDALGIMPIDSAFLIDSYRSVGENVDYDNLERFGHIHSWGMTAQGIYHAGDTIQYKLYIRNQDNNTLTPAPKKGYSLRIIDPTGKKVQEIHDLTLNAFGAYAGEFPVPVQAPVGWYQFKVTADFAVSKTKDADTQQEEEQSDDPDNNDATRKFTWTPMRVLVSDFTPSPFRVTNQVNGDLFKSGDTATVSSRAELHSGGIYTDANIRVTATLNSKIITSDHPAARDYFFSSYTNHPSSTQIFENTDRLDEQGTHKDDIPVTDNGYYYGRLMFESAVQDDRGKFVATQSYADYVDVDRFVGLRSKDWVWQTSKPGAINYIVIDGHGTPVAGTEVDIKFQREEVTAARVKGAGNAYITEFNKEDVEAGACHGTSATTGQECRYTPEKPGSYKAVATITDTRGKQHSTEIWFYVAGKEYVQWEGGDDAGLEVVPERKDYKIGDTARFLIKNPWPGAKALITVERYGVIDHIVKTLDSNTPVIEIPVKPDYMPGFYLSVVVFSPRVDKPVENGVDLGKPSFRIGYVTMPVKDAHKEMLITAKSDRAVYKPRETVTVSLHAEPRFKDRNEPIELAVAVLDEAVFDLISDGKSYYDPYQGFYKLEGLDLRNYSLITRLVGRQKFEKKGANPGGDGGSDLAVRNNFKFISYWNPSIPADGNGNATISFPVPDNLTGWRVLAMAVTPTDRMGLGDTSFKVNQPTEIRPSMPNQVLEGDRFEAGFTIMNRTDKPRNIMVQMTADGLVADQKPVASEQVITLAPYKRQNVWLPLKAGIVDPVRDVAEGNIHFTVRAWDDSDGDAVAHDLVVHKRRSLDVAANYGTTTQDKVSDNLKIPQQIHPDTGSISVVLSPSVIGNLEGAFRYMRDYAYHCWEQKMTRALMASSYLKLKDYLPAKFNWDGARDIPQSTLDMAASFQAPNGGMAYFLPKDEYVDPYLSAFTALGFGWLKQAGYTIPEQVETRLDQYLDNFLKQDAFPDFYNPGMASSVRAVALAVLAEKKRIGLADIERFRPSVPQMGLMGKTFFVRAAMQVPGADQHVVDVTKLILSHANQTGGKFIFNEIEDDSFKRILASPLRENCQILSTFTALGERKDMAPLVGDVPFKLVRMITQARGNRDFWENTQENLFCMQGLIDYAHIYEHDKPDMQIALTIGGQPVGTAQFHDVRDAPVTLGRPIAPQDPGIATTATIQRSGQGRIYYATRLMTSPLEETARDINAGMEIHREYSVQRDGKWVLLTSPVKVAAGELVRVDLYLDLPAARNFVVVDDPVPGGLEPVNRDLATASKVDAAAGDYDTAGGSWYFKFNDWAEYNVSRWSFYHQELRHDAVRYYADYLPAGHYHLAYTAQAIAPGHFIAMPVLAAEMYDPDVLGKTAPAMFDVSKMAP